MKTAGKRLCSTKSGTHDDVHGRALSPSALETRVFRTLAGMSDTRKNRRATEAGNHRCSFQIHGTGKSLNTTICADFTVDLCTFCTESG